jgi:two-component system heavy metal sensor histidine kinase CusS
MTDRSRFFSSLAWRLTAWYALSSFFMILLIACISYYALLSAFAKETDGYLTDTVSQLKGILQNDGEKNLKVVVEKELPTRLYLRTFARVVDESGNVRIQSPFMQKILPQTAFPAPIDLDSEAPGVDYFSVQRGRTYRIITVKIDEPQKAIFQVACDRRRESGILKRYKVYLIVVLASSFLLCAAGGFLIARRGIAPVSAIADAAGQIGHVTLHERINSAGLPEELRQLAFSFNAMLDRLEASFARISQFSEDIAHELRTPVNNLRGGNGSGAGETAHA